MRCTIPDVQHGLSRLLEIYTRPRHLPEDPDELAKIWHREIGDLDVDVFRAGVSAYCRTDAEYFPKPGQIRKLGEAVTRPTTAAAGLPGLYAEWERTWAEAPIDRPVPCPVCGATDGWSHTPPTLRRKVWHDMARHLAADVPAIGARAQHQGAVAVVPPAAA